MVSSRLQFFPIYYLIKPIKTFDFPIIDTVYNGIFNLQCEPLIKFILQFFIVGLR